LSSVSTRSPSLLPVSSLSIRPLKVYRSRTVSITVFTATSSSLVSVLPLATASAALVSPDQLKPLPSSQSSGFMMYTSDRASSPSGSWMLPSTTCTEARVMVSPSLIMRSVDWARSKLATRATGIFRASSLKVFSTTTVPSRISLTVPTMTEPSVRRTRPAASPSVRSGSIPACAADTTASADTRGSSGRKIPAAVTLTIPISKKSKFARLRDRDTDLNHP